MAAAIVADPVQGRGLRRGDELRRRRRGRAPRASTGHLTDIMMAQDFHDLTGQVVAKVVTLAADLEDSLVKLLVQVVPPEQRAEGRRPTCCNGPVVNPEGRTDVVDQPGRGRRPARQPRVLGPRAGARPTQ